MDNDGNSLWLRRIQPRPERLAAALRALELDLECQPKLGEKGVDLHGISSDHNPTHLLLAFCLELLSPVPFQDVDVTSDRQLESGHVPPKKGALDTRTGHDLGEHGDEVVQERSPILTTALGEDRSDAGRFE